MARTVESVYPTARARRIADAAVDGLPLEATMLEYILTWEEAYLAAGGKVVL